MANTTLLVHDILASGYRSNGWWHRRGGCSRNRWGAATGAAGGGAFYNPTTAFSGGTFAGGGATAYAGGSNVSVPAQQSSPGVLGASAGGGASVFVTNAQYVQELSGPFTTYSLNVGLGPTRFSAQLALGGNIWDLSLSIGPMGATYGLSGSRVTTNTVTSRGVCK